MKTLSLIVLASVSASAFADESILKKHEENLLGLKINSPLVFPMKPEAAPGKGYQLENEIFWQNGVKIAKKDLIANAPFCVLETQSVYTSEKSPDFTLNAGKLPTATISGRVSESQRFATVISLDEPMVTFTCESSVGELKETTVDEVKVITQGAVEVVEYVAAVVGYEGIEVSQMMLENKKGLSEFNKAHKIGPVIEKAKIERISETVTGRHHSTTVVKYTIVSRDCLGTDACEGTVNWIVTATTTSDGYSWSTSYQNTVTRN